MTVLRMNNCRYCNRRAELVERSGGWTVDCYYAHPWHAVEENKGWCKDAHDENDCCLYDNPNDAIIVWNKENSQPASLV
jgi:hypothetical protein